MKKLLLIILALTSLMIAVAQLQIPQVSGLSTLAETINSVVTSNTWSSDPSVISVGTIFGASSVSAFDSATATYPYEWGWVRQLAAQDGYTSQTIDNQVKNMMSSQTMTGAVPSTYQGNWLTYHRFLVPLYDLASQYNLQSKWSKSAAISLIQNNLQTQKPLLAFGSGGGWYYATRYYDEWIEDLDIALKLGDTSTASMLWNGVNSANWNGQYYAYRADQQDVMECEVGFFACVIGNYKVTVGNIPNFDRISTDLYNKLLVNGWSSPLWGGASMMRHATTNSELRLQNTLGGIEALQMYYGVSGSAYKSAFVNLLSGGTPAWQEFAGCSLFLKSDSDSNAMKAQLLFLYGIIPDTGSLAMPTNEWRYEDRTSMMPSTLFKFNYAARTIRIPVYAGKLKFCFGSSIASYTFPSNGVYQVQFSSDWNAVTSAQSVEGLTRFHFLDSGSSPPPPGYGSIKVSGNLGGEAVAFEAWYDNSNHVTVPAGQTYTFTNVPSGTHTVNGLCDLIQRSDTVTVSTEQTTMYTFDFSATSSRPPWWPSPLPWPLPSFLSTIVSTPLYMFVGVAGVAGVVAVTLFLRMSLKRKKHFSSRRIR